MPSHQGKLLQGWNGAAKGRAECYKRQSCRNAGVRQLKTFGAKRMTSQALNAGHRRLVGWGFVLISLFLSHDTSLLEECLLCTAACLDFKELELLKTMGHFKVGLHFPF